MKTRNSLYAIFLCAALSLSGINAQAESKLTVNYLANEQSVVAVSEATRFLLLPVQDDAPEAKVGVISGNTRVGELANVRLARERVDYYVPFSLEAFMGKDVKIDVLGMPQGSLCWKELKLSDTFDMANREKYRPLYHHTPAYGWMNDPNGMFYKDGVWHLYFQHNPYGSTWGNLSWGYSTSTDLVHWQYEGDPVMPDAWGLIFSGSSVVDTDNTAGFGPGAIVAFYTSAKSTPWGDVQMQSMAYSTDGGKSFTRYEGNPILTSTERDFRDPKVFWYAPGKHWVMLLAVGQQMQIFSSKNLKEWKHESDFGLKQGAHGGVWECPDLVELPIEGTKEKRWVLICNLNPGGPFGGSATQYFVGTFDGKKFTNQFPTKTKWMDYGKDHYATVTFSNAPDGRCVALGWMSNWQYAAVVPTKQYRSANTIARDLTLYRQGGDLLLKSAPSKEIEAARKDMKSLKKFNVSDAYSIDNLLDDNNGAYEIEMEIRNNGAEKIVFTLLNGKGESVKMYYDTALRQFVMDRSVSGETAFSRDFPAMTVAPVPETGDFTLRLFVDRSSIEAFGDGGKFVMTNIVFPSEPYNKMKFESVRGSFTVKKMNVYKLK
jgi:fructan beta-fructosidase